MTQPITHIFAWSALLMALAPGQVPPAPAPVMSMTWGFVPDPAYLAGDSLKYVLSWTQPADSLEAGKIDSTVYILRPSKAVVFYQGAAGAPNVNTRRRRMATEMGDSFKLARPALGDSATFRVTGFTQCRKNPAGAAQCSLPGAAGFSYVRDWRPEPTTPAVKVTVF